MIAHVLADLRDGQLRLGQHQQHAIGLDRPRDVDGLAVTVGQVDQGVPLSTLMVAKLPAAPPIARSVRKVAHAEATISLASRARARQAIEPGEHEDPPRRGRLGVADEERCAAAFGHSELLVQRQGDDLSSKAGALEHVQAARQVLGARQPRQVGASRQLGELAPRQAQGAGDHSRSARSAPAAESRTVDPRPPAAPSRLRLERRTHRRFAALAGNGGSKAPVRATPAAPRDADAVQLFRASIADAAGSSFAQSRGVRREIT